MEMIIDKKIMDGDLIKIYLYPFFFILINFD